MNPIAVTPRIHFVVVIYKKRYNESPTLTTLIASLESCSLITPQQISVDICNNSPVDFDSGSANFCAEFIPCTRVLATPHNEKLSVLYNQSIAHHTTLAPKPDYVILLDDDTQLSPAFFEALFDSLKRFPSHPLFIPIIKSPNDGRVISPNSKRSTEIQPGILPTKGFKCITSGLTLNAKCWPAIKFDEDFTLYGADIDLCHQIGRQYNEVIVLNHELEHHLSKEHKDSDPLADWRRLEKIRAELILCRKYNTSLSYIWRFLRQAIREFFRGMSKVDIKYIKHLTEVISYVLSTPNQR